LPHGLGSAFIGGGMPESGSDLLRLSSDVHGRADRHRGLNRRGLRPPLWQSSPSATAGRTAPFCSRLSNWAHLRTCRL